MKGWIGVALTACLVTMSASTCAAARVNVTRIDYHGWKGAYRMSNGTVDLVVVPQIGRIMRYGYVGGPNVLWENPDLLGKLPDVDHPSPDWINFGGDKVWNAPQERWGWPPDPTLDRGECTVTVTPAFTLQLIGQASPKSGLQFRREIVMAPGGTVVTLRNILVNGGPRADTWAVWEVAQIDNPGGVRLPRSRSGRFPNGYKLFPSYTLGPGMVVAGPREVTIHRSARSAAKIGSDSPAGWIKGDVAGQEFTLSASHQPGRSYADDGCAQEIFVNNDPLKYAEMEMLGPLQEIAPGETAVLVTRWSLKRRPDKKL